MITTTIGWILIITSILTVCSQQCPAGRDGYMCHRRNVALNRTTTQSSNFTHKNRTFPSDSAVDGKTGHDLFNTPCTHTKNVTGQFWAVTLDKSYWIYRFTIYNRNGGCFNEGPCGARLNGFTLSVRNSSGAYTPCYQDFPNSANGPGDVINEHCTNPVRGNIVKISLSSGRPLTLCEVLLYVCDPGTYGTDCGKSCGFCAEGPTTCNTVSGNCPDRPNQPRCMPGYFTEKCDRACSSYRWGPDCEKICGQCHGGAVCDGVTGECPPGNLRCATGYMEPQCTPCDAGKWGSNCLFTCSENCVIPTCNVTTGVCEGESPVVDYTAVIITCLVVVVITAVIITAVVLVVRRRQSGSSQGDATSARNTGDIQEVSNSALAIHGRDSSPNTHCNTAVQKENPNEAVTENEYDMVSLSQLDRNTNYASLR